MPRRTRTRKRGRKIKRSSIIPVPLKKGIRGINNITSKIARDIDKYPLAALRKFGKVVLKPRRLKIGGFMSKTVRQLRNPGRIVKTAKKGGRRRRGGTCGKKHIGKLGGGRKSRRR